MLENGETLHGRPAARTVREELRHMKLPGIVEPGRHE